MAMTLGVRGLMVPVVLRRGMTAVRRRKRATFCRLIVMVEEHMRMPSDGVVSWVPGRGQFSPLYMSKNLIVLYRLKKRKHQSVDLSATSSVNSSLQSSFGAVGHIKGKENAKGLKNQVTTPPVIIPSAPPVPPKPRRSPNTNTIIDGNGTSNHRQNWVERPPASWSVVGGVSGGSSSVHHNTRAQSPTLPPLVISG